MTQVHVCTYATHTAGFLRDLLGNPFHQDIVLLGFGTKWRGYMDKVRAVASYAKTLPEHDLLVFVDGFDTQMDQALSSFVEDFQSLGAPLVVSHEPLHGPLVQFIMDGAANSGLYAGYAGVVVDLCDKMIERETRDDQRALNLALADIDHVIDRDCVLFRNISFARPETAQQAQAKPYFTSFPGACDMPLGYQCSRRFRMCHEYPPLFAKVLLQKSSRGLGRFLNRARRQVRAVFSHSCLPFRI